MFIAGGAHFSSCVFLVSHLVTQTDKLLDDYTRELFRLNVLLERKQLAEEASAEETRDDTEELV